MDDMNFNEQTHDSDGAVDELLYAQYREERTGGVTVTRFVPCAGTRLVFSISWGDVIDQVGESSLPHVFAELLDDYRDVQVGDHIIVREGKRGQPSELTYYEFTVESIEPDFFFATGGGKVFVDGSRDVYLLDSLGRESHPGNDALGGVETTLNAMRKGMFVTSHWMTDSMSISVEGLAWERTSSGWETQCGFVVAPVGEGVEYATLDGESVIPANSWLRARSWQNLQPNQLITTRVRVGDVTVTKVGEVGMINDLGVWSETGEPLLLSSDSDVECFLHSTHLS